MESPIDGRIARSARQLNCQSERETGLIEKEHLTTETESTLSSFSDEDSELSLGHQQGSRGRRRVSRKYHARAHGHSWFSQRSTRPATQRDHVPQVSHQRVRANSHSLHSLLPSHVSLSSSLFFSPPSPSSYPSSSTFSQSSPSTSPSPLPFTKRAKTKAMTQGSRPRSTLLRERKRSLQPSRQQVPSQAPSSGQHVPPVTPQRSQWQQIPQVLQHPSTILCPWRLWESVAVHVFNIPREADTYCLWQAFSKEGHVFSIDIFEDFHGNRESRGKIRFKSADSPLHSINWPNPFSRPPPQKDFWCHGTYPITLSDGKPTFVSITLDLKRPDVQIQSPLRPNTMYPAEVVGLSTFPYCTIFQR